MARLKVALLLALLALVACGCFAWPFIGSDPGLRTAAGVGGEVGAFRRQLATLAVAIKWPERDLPGFKAALIPSTTKAILIEIKKGETVLDAATVLRAEGATSAVATFSLEAQNNLSLLVRAYNKETPDPDVDAQIAPGAATGVNLNPSQVTRVTVQLDASNAPAILSLSSNAGARGDTITITGTNFGGSGVPVSVSFNGKGATSLTRNSESSLTVVVPADARTGQILIVADGVPSTSNAIFWVASGLAIDATKESWDTTGTDTRLVLFDKTMQLRATPTWIFKTGEDADTFGTPPAPLWELSGDAPGSIGSNGVFKAASTRTASLSATLTGRFGGLRSNGLTMRSVIVMGVTLDKTALALNVPAPEGATASGFPSTADIAAAVRFSESVVLGGVTWVSSAPSAATVAATGTKAARVSSAGAGTSVITAKSADDPAVVATASVTVTNDGLLDLLLD